MHDATNTEDKYQVLNGLMSERQHYNVQTFIIKDQCTNIYNQGSGTYFLYQFYIHFLSNLYFNLDFESVQSIDLLVAWKSQLQSLVGDGQFNKSNFGIYLWRLIVWQFLRSICSLMYIRVGCKNKLFPIKNVQAVSKSSHKSKTYRRKYFCI